MITIKEAQQYALKKYKTFYTDEIEKIITKAAMRGDFFVSEVGVIDDEALEELEEGDYIVSGGMSAACQPFFTISWALEDYII